MTFSSIIENSKYSNDAKFSVNFMFEHKGPQEHSELLRADLDLVVLVVWL